MSLAGYSPSQLSEKHLSLFSHSSCDRGEKDSQEDLLRCFSHQLWWFFPWKFLGLNILKVCTESMRILDKNCSEGSPHKTHTLFQQKRILLEERNPAFLITVQPAPGL